MTDTAILREAAEARQGEWQTEGVGISFAGNELAGEIGEALEAALAIIQLSIAGGKACNLIKKLDREANGIRGSTTNLEELFDEIGDVVICADRVLMLVGGPTLGEVAAKKFNKTSDKYGFKTRIEGNEVIGIADETIGVR